MLERGLDHRLELDRAALAGLLPGHGEKGLDDPGAALGRGAQPGDRDGERRLPDVLFQHDRAGDDHGQRGC